MSHRSFNRALGATSLELKCLLLFGISLFAVTTVNFWLSWKVTQESVLEHNPRTGRLLVDQEIKALHWLESQKNQDNSQFAEYFENSLSKDLGTQKYETRIIDVRTPESDAEQPRDEFELELVDDLLHLPFEDVENGTAQDYRERYVDKGTEFQQYQYCQAIWFRRECDVCHTLLEANYTDPFGLGGPSDLAVGDLMCVVSVTFGNDATRSAINRYWGWLLGVAIITAFLAIIAFYMVIRYVIVRPLRHLRDVSDLISRGDISQRADIHTGDEFESLGIAFNRMLRHLVNSQDELRSANASLDGKVDELAQLNMQLHEMNRLKSDFMATMSHELRTPLNSILGFSDVLCSIDALDEKQQRYVLNIQRSGRTLLEMINNVLDLAKIESGKVQMRIADFSIEQIILAQCDLARPLTEKKNIDLLTEIPSELPDVHQDQFRVQQIINNLLSNAIKFTPEGGRIKVVAEPDGDELVLRVIDTGVGISEEDQQAIFEKFRQGSTAMPGGDAMTREYSGTGLGLSIVKELCKLLRGEISVESELGTGSTFLVRLPWHLDEQPRLDSPLMAGFEEFSKARLDRVPGATHQSGPDGPT